MLIYKCTNKMNGRAYIGQTTRTLEERRAEHEHKALFSRTKSAFQKALDEYGFNNFKWEVLESDVSTLEELSILEKHHINLIGIGNLYNTSTNTHHQIKTEQTKLKIKNTLKGRKCGYIDDETRKK